MPASALRGDHVQYSVLLDQLVALLVALVAEPEPSEPLSTEVQAELTRLLSTSKVDRERSLDRSIVDILAVMRRELVMDIVFVSKEAGDAVIATHSTPDQGELGR
jgi:adenosyl cobinamide kinase/adenosyl cobinamide phosphate guanylyltransferase